jgi:aquaporin Z
MADTTAEAAAPVSPAPATTVQRLVAEALGTFVLVFLGCGTFLYLDASSLAAFGGSAVATALGFGLTLMVMTFALGRVSGAHFNPAVSVGAAMGGRMSWAQVPAYVGAQLVGAILGAAVLWVLLHGFDGLDAGSAVGANFFGDRSPSNYAWWAAFLLELVLTLVLVLVILAVTDSRNEHPALAPLAIGLSLTAIYFVALPLTGGSVNPARSIGPGLFAGTDAIIQLWLFIVAPLVGGAAAGALYPLLFGHGAEPVPGSGFSLPSRPAAAVPGYGAPDSYQQAWNQQAVAAEQAAWVQEPIIQDGWQWDHVAQEWKPLEQWQPAQPAAPAQQAPQTGQFAQPAQQAPQTGQFAQPAQPAQPQQPVQPQQPAPADAEDEDTRISGQGFQPPQQQQGWNDPNAPR